MIKTVTITGADESIEPVALAELYFQFPFVEWGILVSKRSSGNAPRFPDFKWITKLGHVANAYPEMKFSCHLCGRWVRDFVNGDDAVAGIMSDNWDIFQRVQLNFHAIPHKASETLPELIKYNSEKEFIFQYDGVNDKLIRNLVLNEKLPNISLLFDKSGGIGKLPDKWPKPIPQIKCGYAGGLSPDNLEEQIQIIDKISHDVPQSWIDVETHVRSHNDRQFDLLKVKRFLEIAKKYVK